MEVEEEKSVLGEMVALMHERMGGSCTEKVIEYGLFPRDLGSIENSEGYAVVTGPCGDTDEMFLGIKGGRIQQVKFTTDGCLFTIAACQAVAYMAVGRTVHECLRITQHAVIEHLGGLPVAHEHCALLASMTLQKALRDYAVKQKNLSP